MQTNLFLDLDGVMADFDAGFYNLFRRPPNSLPDDDMWALINAQPAFFYDLPMCAGALQFFCEISHFRPIVLTACPKLAYQRVAIQKRDWVHKYLGANVLVLPVMGRHNKKLFLQQAGDILIDDWAENCKGWAKAGGIAIHHQGDFAATKEKLYHG
jgi:5'-nucleotidase